ncbi:MAG: N-acetyltransferase family protein [Gemmatimonadales bacterium]
MPTLSIDRAGLDDLALLAPLFIGYRAFYRKPPEADRVRAFLSDRLRHQDSIVLLARLDGIAVGFTQLYPTFSSVSIGRAFVLNDLFVDPAARSHGVGRALLERAAAFARQEGALYLELATGVTNAGAQRLYEATGWVRDTDFYHYSLDLRTG